MLAVAAVAGSRHRCLQTLLATILRCYPAALTAVVVSRHRCLHKLLASILGRHPPSVQVEPFAATSALTRVPTCSFHTLDFTIDGVVTSKATFEAPLPQIVLGLVQQESRERGARR